MPGIPIDESVGARTRRHASRMLAPVWPYGEAHHLYEDVDSLNANMNRMDVLAALRLVDTMNRRLVKIASDVVEIAAKETTLTQKQVAEALGVTPATLRGWRD